MVAAVEYEYEYRAAPEYEYDFLFVLVLSFAVLVLDPLCPHRASVGASRFWYVISFDRRLRKHALRKREAWHPLEFLRNPSLSAHSVIWLALRSCPNNHSIRSMVSSSALTTMACPAKLIVH